MSGFTSNFSNYPPGVTGNEPEIVGYDEDNPICESCDEERIYCYDCQRDYCPECDLGGCEHLLPHDLIDDDSLTE